LGALRRLSFLEGKLPQTSFPDMILPDLFISNQLAAENPMVLRHLHVTHVVRVVPGFWRDKPAAIELMHVRVLDTSDVKLIAYFSKVCAFIDKARGVNGIGDGTSISGSSGGSGSSSSGSDSSGSDSSRINSEGVVLVHCQMGVSRSAAIVIAYVMHHLRLSLKESCVLMKGLHPCRPNSGFMEQLREWESSLGLQRPSEARPCLPLVEENKTDHNLNDNT